MGLRFQLSCLLLVVLAGSQLAAQTSPDPDARAKQVQTPDSLDQFKALMAGGGNLAILENRLEVLVENEKDPALKLRMALELARLQASAGEAQSALKTLIPYVKEPQVAHFTARLALICNDEMVFRNALFPLLSDPSSPAYPEARQILALQLFRTEKYAAVLENLGKDPETDDLSALLAYLSLQRLGKPMDATARLARYTSRPASAIFRNLIHVEKGWEFDPVFLVLFGLGDLPGLLESADSDERSVAAVEEEKNQATSTAKGTARQELIQVGWFASMENAKELQKKLESLAFQVRILKEDRKLPVRYKVVVEVPAGVDAQTILLSLKDKDIEGFLTH